jgi:hypothetical protein
MSTTDKAKAKAPERVQASGAAFPVSPAPPESLVHLSDMGPAFLQPLGRPDATMHGRMSLLLRNPIFLSQCVPAAERVEKHTLDGEWRFWEVPFS